MASASQQTSWVGLPPLAAGVSWMDAVDPRSRIVAAVLFSAALAAASQLLTLAVALVTAAAATRLARLQWRGVFRRLIPVNLFALALVLVLPLSTGQSQLFAIGPVGYSREGLLFALVIALKANAIVLSIMALLGSVDTVTLGHALQHLGLPDKLSQLLLFTIRYLDVLHGEYVRLRTAMKLRGFRPRVNAHTYRTYGYLVGMLLVRSVDRSERILAAMKCRGFRGRFHLFHHFALTLRDVWFASIVFLLLVSLGLLECS
jgi:cobalt/nickel transport system permease protein